MMPIYDFSDTGHEGLSFENMVQGFFACGIVVVDPKGEIISMTPAAQKLLGPSSAQIHHRSVESLPVPLQSIIREAQTTGRAVNERRIVLQQPAGTGSIPVSVTAIPFSEKPRSVVLLLQDFSAAGKLEENLRRLDRLASFGTLSASMAHEIRNALVAVKTFMDLLPEQNRDAELADVARREMKRVDAIVGRMMKFATPAKPAFSPVRLHEILEHSLRIVQPRIESKLISFHKEFHAAPDSFSGDDYQLEQAFVNLLLNAIEAICSSGTLTLATDLVAEDSSGRLREKSKAARFIRITIADTGVGIPIENVGRIFEPFFTTKQNGTGLGLPVTRRIIEEHGGRIRVESDVNKGTRFTVLLPSGSPRRNAAEKGGARSTQSAG
jgi:nitrogen-specific signal transduction histidine kinase